MSFSKTHTKFCDLDFHFALQWTLILTFACFFSFATSISYTYSEHFQLQGHIHIFSFSLFSICCNPVFSPYIYDTIFNHFQGFFKVPFPMEKGPVFSQKVDEISRSEVHQTFSNFSFLIDKYLGILSYSNAKKRYNVNPYRATVCKLMTIVKTPKID